MPESAITIAHHGKMFAFVVDDNGVSFVLKRDGSREVVSSRVLSSALRYVCDTAHKATTAEDIDELKPST